MNALNNENFTLADKLRNENPEQFYTLVRMHLSFVLDLNTDDCDGNSEKKSKVNKWNLLFSKKQKTGSKTCFEGPLLTFEFISQMKPVIEFLKQEKNISQEGIFRRSGRVTRQQELKVLLHQGAELNFNDGQFSVHECATVLKNILSELPESVLTDAHFPAYCQIAEFCGKNSSSNDRLLRSIQLLILLLPNENRKFLQEIIELLNLAVSHEEKNRMSAENLATLFTPHLLCPRRLSPEALHSNSQMMSPVVAFMIQKGLLLFEIPPTLATDVKMYWNKKEQRKLSPFKQMNESICDGTVANTVFTFVDREKTAQENRINPTETALAQLYAYIQSLPESSKKRKLIKQFNKENGYGTPLRAVNGKKRTKALNLGDSIKKHLSGFSKSGKRGTAQGILASLDGEDEGINSPDTASYLKKNFNKNYEKSQKENIDLKKRSVKNSTNFSEQFERNPLTSCFDDASLSLKLDPLKQSEIITSCEILEERAPEVSHGFDNSLTKTLNSPEQIIKTAFKRNSPSPVESDSPFKSPCLYGINVPPNTPSRSTLSKKHQYCSVSNQNFKTHLIEPSNILSQVRDLNNKNVEFPNTINKTPAKPVDNSTCDTSADATIGFLWKTPVQKFNLPNCVQLTNNDVCLPSSNNTNRKPIFYGPKTPFLMTTSTPATCNNCLLTPIVEKNNSMSPITKSTKRMPKAMQETMMTPRSRKPVISLSGTDLCNFGYSGSREGNEDEYGNNTPKTSANAGKKLILDSIEDSIEDANDSITSTFRNYLFSRSILTASPVDLSFSSRADDFLSDSEKNSSEENENFRSLPQILDDTDLSKSLLYCLDGNLPPTESEKNDNRCKISHCSCSFSDCDESLHRVYETAL